MTSSRQKGFSIPSNLIYAPFSVVGAYSSFNYYATRPKSVCFQQRTRLIRHRLCALFCASYCAKLIHLWSNRDLCQRFDPILWGWAQDSNPHLGRIKRTFCQFKTYFAVNYVAIGFLSFSAFWWQCVRLFWNSFTFLLCNLIELVG